MREVWWFFWDEMGGRIVDIGKIVTREVSYHIKKKQRKKQRNSGSFSVSDSHF